VTFVLLLLAGICSLKAQEPTTQPVTNYTPHAWDSIERVKDSTLNAAYLAIARDSTLVDEYQKIIDIHKARKQQDRQLQIAKRMASANPASALAYLSLGDAQLDNDLPDSAVVSLKRALTIDPNFVRAHTMLAEAYTSLKYDDSALIHLDSAVAYNPRYAQAHVQRAALLSKLGRDSEAVEDYRAASELLPAQFSAWYKLGKVLMKVHDYEEAASALKYACSLDSSSADALFLFAEASAGAGQTQAATHAYEQFMLRFPTHSQALEAERRARAMGGGRP
jgi:tetratricopeptide (TPR) repeat protein